jgi:hypothetical protein
MKFTEGNTTRGWGDLPFCFSQVLPPVQFARKAELNPYDQATFYGGDTRGYTDYPTISRKLEI